MTDPRRLREDGDDAVVANLLDAARAYHRPAASRSRILRVLGLPVAISVGVPAAAIASSFGTKLVLIVSTATAVVAGGSAVVYRTHVRARAHQAAAVVNHRIVTAPSQRQPQTAPTFTEGPAAPTLEDPPTPAPPPDPVVAAVSARVAAVPARAAAVASLPPARKHAPVGRSHSSAAPRLRSEPSVAPVAGPEPDPTAPSQPIAPPPASLSTPEASRQVASPRPLPAPVARAQATAPRRPPLAREIALLDAAEQAERRRDHRAALAGLEAYRREFPGGALLAEAEVLRISALFSAGDTATARAHARAFLAGSAPSPLTARVASMLSRASSESETKEQP
jgi:hypothetical protein